MKQDIDCLKKDQDPVTDLNLLFLGIYNLLYQKAMQEPQKGIVACKGKPNQRKVTWKELLIIAHSLEDYLNFRTIGSQREICQSCSNWKQTSEHIGECKPRHKYPVHAWHTCKRWRGVTRVSVCND